MATYIYVKRRYGQCPLTPGWHDDDFIDNGLNPEHNPEWAGAPDVLPDHWPRQGLKT